MSQAAVREDARISSSGLAIVIICGGLISLVSFGPRTSMGLFLAPLSDANNWSREVFALALAVQNLVWGFGQPLFGAIADRWGASRVIVVGAFIYALGLSLTATADTPLLLNLAAGVLIGLGIAGTAFALVMTAFGKLVPADKRSWAFGIAMAAGSLGQFIFAPLGQAVISSYDWQTALYCFAIAMLVLPLLALGLRGSGGGGGTLGMSEQTFRQALSEAFGHRSYVLLTIGFFVCGFQLAFIYVHLPAYLNDLGLEPSYGAWALATIGLFNVIGAYGAGVLGARLNKRSILCWIYFLRAASIAFLILMPVSLTSLLIFSASMGLLWLSTVPLTSGLVAGMFGLRYLGTLFGIVFLSHQVGSFFGIYLGSVFYEWYGNYDLFWWLAIATGLFAAAVHYPIRETPVARLQMAG